jgi:pimeloyl-ACP methyl ester carboxylesterase
MCPLAAGVIAVLTLLAAPVTAQPFQKCEDSTAFPALHGSLCAVAQTPLMPTAAADEESVALFMRKFPTADSGRRRGEIWFVAGGPGESGASFYPVLAVLRRAFPDYDLVMPDHRGTGYSSKLCEKEEAPDSPSGVALAREEWGPCIAAMHTNIRRTHAFTITNAAHDLSTLIGRYRGEGEVYLYGVSYGTQLVLRMMQVAPIELDGVILDGLVPPESASQWDLSHRTRIVDAVGRTLLSRVQTSDYRRLLAQEQAWQKAVPDGDLRQFMGSLLSFPALRGRISDIVESLSRGDAALLARTAADLEAQVALLNSYPQSPPSLPLVALISGSENNGRRDLTAETVAEEAREALFSSPLPGLLVDSSVSLYERDRYFGQTLRRLPRTLVIHGTLDPNTPYEGAREHAAVLAPAGDIRFTTVSGGAHFLALMAPDCFVRAASAFVARAVTPDRCDIPQ